MDLATPGRLAGVTLSAFLVLSLAPGAFGHGVGSETFPPTDLGGRQVTLEAFSSQPDDAGSQQISISLLDFDSKITLWDVTFHIRAERGSQFLLEREFQADNGFLVFNFVSDRTGSVTVEEEQDGNLFGSLLGLESRKINVRGPGLADGGLYKFAVSILTADGYSERLDVPLEYDVGISVPQSEAHEILHPDFGSQTIRTITYYDELSNFNYDMQSKTILFEMPFEWTESNMEQTSVVHAELIIPKTFGELLASSFVAHVNGVRLPDVAINVDDFADDRTVHLIMGQQELRKVYEEGTGPGMKFALGPDPEDKRLSAVTENNQFRVFVSWEPEMLKSGSEATVSFAITDVFLRNSPVAVSYDFAVTDGQKTIFEQSGTSTKGMHDTAEFFIPEGTGRIIGLNFSNMSGNHLASASVSVIVDSAVQQASMPPWIKSNAGWWADGSIDDQTFLRGIEFLIANGVILVPDVQQTEDSGAQMPPWIKSNAGWWADGSIDDQTFLRGIEFLIANGILVV